MKRADRQALVKLESGGLLLDLDSGTLFRLNESAAFAWEQWLSGLTRTEIAAAFARRYRLSSETAHQHLTNALSTSAGDAVASEVNEFHYARTPGGYAFSRAGAVLLTIADGGGAITLGPAVGGERDSIGAVLRGVAPKLLALRGHFVLHASAVAIDGAAIAFCGASGAGKTTTAQSVARAGPALLSEDQLIVRSSPGGLLAVADGEARIRAWSSRAAGRLAAGDPVSGAELDEAGSGSLLPLREIGFIDALRRRGETISAAKMAPLGAAVGLFRNSFYGSDLPGDWVRHLQAAAEMTARLDGYDLAMPAGLTKLDTAAADLGRRGSLGRFA